jgi:DNA-binding CsgD family transcriptional regulator
LSKLDFGKRDKHRGPNGASLSYQDLLRSVGQYCLASVFFCFIFGSIMQMDVLRGYGGFIISPEAQLANIAVTLTLFVYVLLKKDRLSNLAIVAVPLLLATILMARTLVTDQSFFTSSLPMVLFNFFGLFVWIMFAWKGYESPAGAFCVFSLGLGSMRLGLLMGRSFVSILTDTVGFSSVIANTLSIISLWVLFVAVLIAVSYVLWRNRFEQLPFGERHDGPGPSYGPPALEKPSAGSVYQSRFNQVAEKGGLSSRETEILGMYASGRSSTYIAEELFLSHYTVKSHLRRCYTKLDVHSRQALLDLIWEGKDPSQS